MLGLDGLWIHRSLGSSPKSPLFYLRVIYSPTRIVNIIVWK